LIDNCDFVAFTIAGPEAPAFKYTKAWADAAIDGDIKAQAATEEEFRAFLGKIDSYDLPPVEPE